MHLWIMASVQLKFRFFLNAFVFLIFSNILISETIAPHFLTFEAFYIYSLNS